ncbi:MAG TPA: DUF2336 domain-containing protein [Rhizomicrobium sp.]|nr:DUF2336 domain-containing protein [Rhizomicrobium sp.]
MDARLKRLIDLAENPAPPERAALALELCDLLAKWPAQYPAAMREPFETLLEKCLREVDGPTRAHVAARITARAETPVPLLNALFFDAPAEARPAILRRNAETNGHRMGHAADEARVIAAARRAGGEAFAAEFARLLGIAPLTARRILAEPSGNALAIACKGAHLTRAAFSALAVLFAPDARACEKRLEAFDNVPQDGADNMVRYWQNEAA